MIRSNFKEKTFRDELKRHNFPVAGTTTPMEQDQPEQMT